MVLLTQETGLYVIVALAIVIGYLIGVSTQEEKINQLKKESEKLEQVKEEVSKKKVSEIEIELNLSGFKSFGNAAYNILIKKKVLFYLLLILAVTVGWYIHTASIPALLNPLQSNSPLIGNNYLGMGGSLSGLDPYTFYIQMQNTHQRMIPRVHLLWKEDLLVDTPNSLLLERYQF